MTNLRIPGSHILLTALAGIALVPTAALANPPVVYTSGSHVQTWDPIFLDLSFGAGPDLCTPTPLVGLNANWINPHSAFEFGTGAHPWQGSAGFTASWINAWSDLGSRGEGGNSWTKYATTISGTGDFVLDLLADNCSWMYLDGRLIGFQGWEWWTNPSRKYPVSLYGTHTHTLEFIVYDGGGLAGGMYRLETNTGTVFPDTDSDGLTDAEEILYSTDPADPDTDDDGVLDGADDFPRNPLEWLDSDGDGVGDNSDICRGNDATGDYDGDRWCSDGTDNCPANSNADQADEDRDGIGNVCEADTDQDGVIDDYDNCALVKNFDQANTDDDAQGDTCDADDDNDGSNDDDDNCPVIANASQADFDDDGIGDACDEDDEDADTVLDPIDLCASTPLGVPVNTTGCSGTQYVALTCGTSTSWSTHGQYVSCVAHATNTARGLGLLTGSQGAVIVSTAAKSSTGRR